MNPLSTFIQWGKTDWDRHDRPVLGPGQTHQNISTAIATLIHSNIGPAPFPTTKFLSRNGSRNTATQRPHTLIHQPGINTQPVLLPPSTKNTALNSIDGHPRIPPTSCRRLNGLKSRSGRHRVHYQQVYGKSRSSTPNILSWPVSRFMRHEVAKAWRWVMVFYKRLCPWHFTSYFFVMQQLDVSLLLVNTLILSL